MQSLLKRFTLLLTLLISTSLSFSSLSFANDDASSKAWKMINQGALIVDVRTAQEFNQGHIANAINIPYELIAEEFIKRQIAKDQPVVLYCRSGRRSSIAQNSLIKLGYSHTHNGGSYQQLSSQKQ